MLHRFKNFSKKAPIYAAFFFLFACTTSEQPEKLYRFQPELNSALVYNMEITSKMQQTYEGTVYESSMIQYFTLHQTPKAYENEQLLMEVYFSNLEVKVFSQQQTLRIRSKSKDSTDFRSQVVKMLVNKPFQITYRLDGSIVEITGWDSLIAETIVAEFSQSDVDVNYTIAEFIKTFGGQTLVGHLELVNSYFPDGGQLVTGEAWTKPVLFSNTTAEKEHNMAYTHQIEDGEMLVEGVSFIKTAPQVDPITQITYALGGNIKLQVIVDQSNGLPINARITQKLKGTATLPISAQRPEGYEMPMSTTNEVRFERINQ